MISIMGGSKKYPRSHYSTREWQLLRDAFLDIKSRMNGQETSMFNYDIERIIAYCQENYEKTLTKGEDK